MAQAGAAGADAELVVLKELAGVRLRISASSELAPLCEWHFDRLPAASTPAAETETQTNTESSSTVELRVRVVSRHPGEPLTEGPRPLSRIGRMTVDRHEQQLTVEHDAGALAVVARNGVDLSIWAAPELRWLCLRQMLFVALSWTLAAAGRFVLHGALVERAGHGALILGGTGQGKSTLALAALASGAQIHSDDLVVAELGPNRGRLWGIPKRVSAPPEVAVGLRPSIAASALEPVPGDQRGRLLLPLELLAHGPVDAYSIVLAAHHEGSGALEALSPSNVRELVIGSFEFARDPDLLKQAFPALIAVGSRPGFVARHAADPAQRLAAAAWLVGEILDQ